MCAYQVGSNESPVSLSRSRCIIGRCFHRFVIWGLPVFLVLSLEGSTQAPFASLDEVFREYVTGDPDRAVVQLAVWDSRRVKNESSAIAEGMDRNTKLALALLHYEAGSVAGMRFQPQADAAERLVDEVRLEAQHAGDTVAQELCRDVSLLRAGSQNWRYLRKQYPGDPVVTLAYGRWLEYWAPHVDNGPDGYGFMIGPVLLRTSHGQFGQEAFEAVGTLRLALEQNPDVVEARVRLGRVLWQLDRRDEAERELVRGKADASSLGLPHWGYLAGVFLGQVHEENQHLVDAEKAYRDAAAVLPTGTIAVLRLSRLLVSTDREAEGWRLLATALEAGSTGPDPWVAYFTDQRDGVERKARDRALRQRLLRIIRR